MKKIKFIIDILLFTISFLLININNTGILIHETLGISIIVLIILHIILNYKWIKNISKNIKKCNLKTKLIFLTNIVIFVCFLLTIILGILISKEIFKFSTMDSYKFIIAHYILGRLSIVIMLIHFGFHIRLIINKIKRNKNFYYITITLYILFSLIICLYMLDTLTSNYLWNMLFN
jgi:cytochrome b561